MWLFRWRHCWKTNLQQRIAEWQEGAVQHGSEESWSHHARRQQGVHDQPVGWRGLRRCRPEVHGIDDGRVRRRRPEVVAGDQGEGCTAQDQRWPRGWS